MDISTPLRNGMLHWPGDASFERRETLKLAQGAECNLSELHTSAHMGTHLDAPRHFLEGGAGIDAMPIAAMVGRARVIAIQDPELIRIRELEAHRPAQGERLLFKTANSSPRWKTGEFQENFVHIPSDTAAYLAGCGVLTVGVDYLSVGGYQTDGAETHRILLGAGTWIIEGLDLELVEAGDYELLCLPLKIVDGDGAPARALVRRLVR
ncbi:MAG: cyclase family protein [Acidobacteriia bacterium]|nr:cyclase family protein [Terriglobia bacterium]